MLSIGRPGSCTYFQGSAAKVHFTQASKKIFARKLKFATVHLTRYYGIKPHQAQTWHYVYSQIRQIHLHLYPDTYLARDTCVRALTCQLPLRCNAVEPHVAFEANWLQLLSRERTLTPHSHGSRNSTPVGLSA